MTTRAYLRNFQNKLQLKAEMERIGVDLAGLDIMAPKGIHHTVILKDVDPRAANIIKQEFLSKGGEAALAYHCLSNMDKCSDMVLMATERQYRIIIQKFRKQPFGLAGLATELEMILDNLSISRKFEIPCGASTLNIGPRTLIMGILNVTPDSFSDGGRFLNLNKAVAQGIKMADDGADIIDIGGESTRPGSARISVDEELKRVIPAIEALSRKVKVPISIDTSKPEVAWAAIEAGACMINDVTGLSDPKMIKLAVEKNVPVVIMHMLGHPGTMQKDPQYVDVVDDIIEFFRERVVMLEEHGIRREQIIIDPGIGFGKTLEHNLEILRRLGEFRVLGLPILVGSSRKSFIGKLQGTGTETGQGTGMGADERLEGSLATAVISAHKGANIVRVHDVRETKQALLVSDAISKQS